MDYELGREREEVFIILLASKQAKYFTSSFSLMRSGHLILHIFKVFVRALTR